MSAAQQTAHHQNCGPTVNKTAEQRPNSLALPSGHPRGFRVLKGLGFRVEPINFILTHTHTHASWASEVKGVVTLLVAVENLVKSISL